MRRALFPSEVAASTPIGLSVPRFPAPHTLAAFSIRPRIHFGRLPRLDCHITDCFHQHHYIVPHPSQRRLTAPTVQFSAGIFVLCVARRSRTHHPGATRQLVEPTRLELVASCSQIRRATNCATAPYWLEVLHHARSGVEPDRLGTRTPLHLQG